MSANRVSRLLAVVATVFLGVVVTTAFAGSAERHPQGVASFAWPSAASASLPAAQRSYPWQQRLAKARAYARSRQGKISIAVTDEGGKLRLGWRARQPTYSASVLKVMLMTAYLNRGSIRARKLTAHDRSLLAPMIRKSDNDTASQIWTIVGDAGLRNVARRGGMKRFMPGGPVWGDSRITASDQARFFIKVDRLIPARHRAYARQLLRTVVWPQRWGIPRVLPSGWTIFFKGGWRPTETGRLVNQVALLEKGDRRVSLAILTDGNASHEYGSDTIREVARILLRGLNRYAHA